jgi:outer membrane lipoprotein SlyB
LLFWIDPSHRRHAVKSRLLFASTLALCLSACATTDRGYGYQDRYPDRRYSVRCDYCGVVERIDVARYGDGRTTGAGIVAGAIVGAAVGNQVGSGDGRKAATVAGAVAGGALGNKIERDRAERDVYAVFVRMDDGRRVVVEQRALDGVREGARVAVRDGRARLY